MRSRTARRSARFYGWRPFGIFGSLNTKYVFVVGCPRSGTTFTAGALGKVPGFSDLGEVNELKANIPHIYSLAAIPSNRDADRDLKSIISINHRIAMAARLRGIEQTPETAFLIPELARTFPNARFLHLIRDGRDVAASLLERGWLATGRDSRNDLSSSVDDANQQLGSQARFWVEPDRFIEFEQANEAKRCAWAWRRYESTAQHSLNDLEPRRSLTIRYESLMTDPASEARNLAKFLDCELEWRRIADSFVEAHGQSIGRYRSSLTTEQLDDVVAESGKLLQALGYA